jgi:hypothetical protein
VKKKATKLGPLLQVAAVSLIGFGVTFSLLPTYANSRRIAQQPSRNLYSGLHFVFADLDGDHIPDLALVEMQSQRSTETNYSIRVKLSHGAESAIGVNGPVGGLRVAAQDVNGDNNVDLVITGNLDGRFIEILLNDGRGNFSVASPEEISPQQRETDRELESKANDHSDLATLISARASHEDGTIGSCDFVQPSTSDSCYSAETERAIQRPSFARQGRSPPTPILLS